MPLARNFSEQLLCLEKSWYFRPQATRTKPFACADFVSRKASCGRAGHPCAYDQTDMPLLTKHASQIDEAAQYTFHTQKGI